MKISTSREISDELPFHRPAPSHSTLVATDNVESHLNFEFSRGSGYPVNTAEGETTPSTAIHEKVKFILQDSQTRKFMRCDSIWSNDINEAMDFLSIRRAVLFGIKELKAVFHILEVGYEGIRATTAIEMGMVTWSKAPGAAHVTQNVTGQNNAPSHRRMLPISVAPFKIAARFTIGAVDSGKAEKQPLVFERNLKCAAKLQNAPVGIELPDPISKVTRRTAQLYNHGKTSAKSQLVC